MNSFAKGKSSTKGVAQRAERRGLVLP